MCRFYTRKMSAYPARESTPSWILAPPESLRPTNGAPNSAALSMICICAREYVWVGVWVGGRSVDVGVSVGRSVECGVCVKGWSVNVDVHVCKGEECGCHVYEGEGEWMWIQLRVEWGCGCV